MVKNFSVDWLAQSFYEAPVNELERPERKTQRPHVPCLVQPRAPTSYDKVYLQPKPKISKAETQTECSKEVKTVSASRNCTSPSCSENSGYSSGYESEAAVSECASVEDGHEQDKDAATRRIRTKFTPDQIEKLEKIFNKHKYLDAGERVKTAVKLNLSETQVRTWFQNRRMKLKREVQEMRADYLLPHMVIPAVHPAQYPCYDGQRLPFPSHVSMMHHMPSQQMMMMMQNQSVLHSHPVMIPRQHFY